ncbi:MAG: hypothetical protein EXQ56_13535 [Acidobacteria bacterium]|nr:hypothetical protein [Acidobacteriota bacterium]
MQLSEASPSRVGKIRKVGLIWAILLFPFIAQSQNIQWARQYGTGRAEAGNSISTMEGNVYVVGDTIGVLPGQINTNLNDRDAFVTRFDTLGNQTWTRQFGATTAAQDVATGAAADGAGVYVVGWTSGTLPQQSRQDGTDAFIRKYDASGAEVWTRQFGTLSDDEALAVVSHTSGVYVVGVVNCCGSNLTPGFPVGGGKDAFIRKYDGNGAVLWTRQFGTVDGESANGVAIDNSGVYVTWTTGGAFAGPSGLGDGFLVKFDHSGAVV